MRAFLSAFLVSASFFPTTLHARVALDPEAPTPPSVAPPTTRGRHAEDPLVKEFRETAERLSASEQAIDAACRDLAGIAARGAFLRDFRIAREKLEKLRTELQSAFSPRASMDEGRCPSDYYLFGQALTLVRRRRALSNDLAQAGTEELELLAARLDLDRPPERIGLEFLPSPLDAVLALDDAELAKAFRKVYLSSPFNARETLPVDAISSKIKRNETRLAKDHEQISARLEAARARFESPTEPNKPELQNSVRDLEQRLDEQKLRLKRWSAFAEMLPRESVPQTPATRRQLRQQRSSN